MIYGSKPSKPVPPPKVNVQTTGRFNGPQAYTYSCLAKQPGCNYEIRLRDLKRTRMADAKIEIEENLSSLSRQARHTELIGKADKKYLYNQIKKMVESEMKANEHLFLEECPNQEIKVEEEIIEHPKMTKEDIIQQLEEIKKIKEEEERKFVEEKRLQILKNNSEKLRIAAATKQKNEISVMNYNKIQEKERFIKEQRIKNIELANLKNMEIFKNQALEKEEEKRKIREKKLQFQMELQAQLQERDAIRNHEKQLQIIEFNENKKLIEKYKEEDELKKLDRIKKQVQIREEIEQFTKNKLQLFSQSRDAVKSFNETLAYSMKQYLKDDIADKITAKIQLQNENDMFEKHQAVIKEERKRQNEAITKKVLQQIKEIEELKLSVEQHKAEVQRKRAEDGNKVLIEQINMRKIILEEQKVLQRKMFEEVRKEHEEYLKEKQQLCENKIQAKWRFKEGLDEQIRLKNCSIENQRKIDMEDHEKCIKEIDEQDKLLNKLLNEL